MELSKGNMTRVGASLIALFLCSAIGAQSDREPPQIPIGNDAYLQWQRWPYQRIGQRTYMRSTFDRAGGNEAADASHFLYQEADDSNTVLDVKGAGILLWARYNHWHGSPWHYEIDGHDHTVQESTTPDPDEPVFGSMFIPEKAFPPPLACTWAFTKGADLSWVPIEFTKSFRMSYGRTHYGTGAFIFTQFIPGANVSHSLRAWDEKVTPPQAVLDLLNASGRDLLSEKAAGGGSVADLRQTSGSLSLPLKATTETLFTLVDAPCMIRGFEMSAPREQAEIFGRVRLRVWWDGRDDPSIDVPVAQFFGAGTFFNRDDREYLIKSFPLWVRFDADRVYAKCFFPMPYFLSAKFEILKEEREAIPDVQWRVCCEPYRDPINHVAYFHATYRDTPTPELGRSLLLLDTQQAEGGGDWSGHLVGTTLIFSHEGNWAGLEGDPRFYFDDSLTAQGHGGGTEEWCGGGSYWGGHNVTMPLVGHPTGVRLVKNAKNDTDKIESAYRFCIADVFPFGKNARITLEHGGENEVNEHYETVAYWYGAPSAALVKTDELDIGSTDSEAAHRYRSPSASKPYEVSSRFEWGPHVVNGKEIFPPHTETARHTTGTSEFVVKLDPDNLGVMLRRKLDYAWPDQCAEVFIADASTTGTVPDWKSAGMWYTAGSDFSVFSNPLEETGDTDHIVQSSNRRFKEEEFLVPLELTKRKSAIAVRLRFRPIHRRLFPDYPLRETAWSEIRYKAYCYVMPRAGEW